MANRPSAPQRTGPQKPGRVQVLKVIVAVLALILVVALLVNTPHPDFHPRSVR